MPFPSVTTVLSPFCDFSRIPEGILLRASERGTAVHRTCACLALGLWTPPVSPELVGYVSSFRGWLFHVEDVVFSEGELTDQTLGYRGHPDLIVRMRGDEGLSLVDLKTPAACSPTWRAQIAAYRNLAEAAGYEISRAFTLRLSKDGHPAKVDEFTGSHRADLAAFLAALTAYKYFKGVSP